MHLHGRSLMDDGQTIDKLQSYHMLKSAGYLKFFINKELFASVVLQFFNMRWKGYTFFKHFLVVLLVRFSKIRENSRLQ